VDVAEVPLELPVLPELLMLAPEDVLLELLVLLPEDALVELFVLVPEDVLALADAGESLPPPQAHSARMEIPTDAKLTIVFDRDLLLITSLKLFG
jgi:hypothetical protein